MINRHDPGYEGKGSRRWRGGFTELETRLAMCKGKIRKPEIVSNQLIN